MSHKTEFASQEDEDWFYGVKRTKDKNNTCKICKGTGDVIEESHIVDCPDCHEYET